MYIYKNTLYNHILESDEAAKRLQWLSENQRKASTKNLLMIMFKRSM